MAYEDESDYAFIRTSSDDAVPYDDGTLATPRTFTYCYITHRPVYEAGGSLVEAGDHEYPELGEAWHHLMVDYAKARLMERWDTEGAQRLKEEVYKVLSASGAKLDYTNLGGR